jgi:hypothetical protein
LTVALSYAWVKDYFFHPLQRTSLARIMRNLSEAQYWLAAKECATDARPSRLWLMLRIA